MSEEITEKRNEAIDRAARTKEVEPRKSRLEIAQERAAQIGIELPVFDPDQVVPELVGRGQHLAEAIVISVSKGNQQGAVFLKKILGANPGVSFPSEWGAYMILQPRRAANRSFRSLSMAPARNFRGPVARVTV